MAAEIVDALSNNADFALDKSDRLLPAASAEGKTLADVTCFRNEVCPHLN